MYHKFKYEVDIYKEIVQSGKQLKYLENKNYNNIEVYNLLVESCNKGDNFALLSLGSFYDNGWAGLKQDFNKALYFYLLSFRKLDNIDAGIAAAHIYHNQKMFNKSFFIYKRLAKGNIHIGLSAVALHYHNGEMSVKKNLPKALHYYKLAYKYGNLSAPIKIVTVYKEQRKYFKMLLMLIKVIIIVIPQRLYTLFNGTMEERIRMI